MQDKIICKYAGKGLTSFYLIYKGEEYYLFTQNYRRGTSDFYRRGVSLNRALDATKSNRNTAILHTMCKLPVYIKHLEKEYGLCIFDKSKQRACRTERTLDKTYDNYDMIKTEAI